MDYDGKTLLVDQNLLLPNLIKPELLMTDLQLALWPVAALQQCLSKPWRLEVNNIERDLYYGHVKQVEIHSTSAVSAWSESVDLINYSGDYQLHINTIHVMN